MVQIRFASPFYEAGLHNFETTSQRPRHRWYYFKEGYSSDLVDAAINSSMDTYRVKQLNVVDPFSGCGTTALTCSLNSHLFTGIEVNPFLHFTSIAKTRQGKWQKKKFEAIVSDVIRKSYRGAKSNLEGFSTFTKLSSEEKWLFNLSVLRRYTALSREIKKLRSMSKKALMLAAIASAFDCSNVKRDGKALRYKKHWKKLSLGADQFIEKFKKRSMKIIGDVTHHPIDRKYVPQLICGDARKRIFGLKKEYYHLAVTSPPYLNSFDYSDVYRPELFLGGFVSDNDDLRKVRMRTLRSHVQVDWDKKVRLESTILEKIILKLNEAEGLWSSRIPLMVHAYFDDLLTIFGGLYRALKKKGEVWMVIGTSAYGGIHIPVDLIATDIATSVGFRLDSINCLRHLRAAGQQWSKLGKKTNPLRESLIILRKS